MNVVGYCRVSTEDQNLSPEAQKKALGDWCNIFGHTLVHVYEDVGLSGSLEPADRPQLMAALEHLRKIDQPCLLVAKRDRLARSVMVAAMLEQIVVKLGAKIFSVEGNNGDSPDDFLIRGIKDLFAEYERLQIRLRTKAALAIKKARGERVGQIPYGMMKNPQNPDMVIPDMTEQKIIQLIKALHNEGKSYRQICAFLAEKGLDSRGKKWYPTTIGRLLKRAK